MAPLTTVHWGQEEWDHSARGEGAGGRWKGRRVSESRPVTATGGGWRATDAGGDGGNPRG